MGLRDKRRELLDEKAAREEREERVVPVDDQWEYLARNLAKVPGIALEDDFNKHGAQGWEFVAMAAGGSEGYAIFKRRRV